MSKIYVSKRTCDIKECTYKQIKEKNICEIQVNLKNPVSTQENGKLTREEKVSNGFGLRML